MDRLGLNSPPREARRQCLVVDVQHAELPFQSNTPNIIGNQTYKRNRSARCRFGCALEQIKVIRLQRQSLWLLSTRVPSALRAILAHRRSTCADSQHGASALPLAFAAQRRGGQGINTRSSTLDFGLSTSPRRTCRRSRKLLASYARRYQGTPGPAAGGSVIL